MENYEEKVRAAWDPDAKIPMGRGIFLVLNDPYWMREHRVDSHEQIESWAAAWKFTEQRQEEIRQAERTKLVALVNCENCFRGLEDEMACCWEDYENTRGDDQNALIVERVRELCANARILTAQEAALAELKKGWKA